MTETILSITLPGFYYQIDTFEGREGLFYFVTIFNKGKDVSEFIIDSKPNVLYDLETLLDALKFFEINKLKDIKGDSKLCIKN